MTREVGPLEDAPHRARRLLNHAPHHPARELLGEPGAAQTLPLIEHLAAAEALGSSSCAEVAEMLHESFAEVHRPLVA